MERDDIMSNADWIATAFADLESQAMLNYKIITKKHGVICTIQIK